jgi:hypothetical protein
VKKEKRKKKKEKLILNLTPQDLAMIMSTDIELTWDG